MADLPAVLEQLRQRQEARRAAGCERVLEGAPGRRSGGSGRAEGRSDEPRCGQPLDDAAADALRRAAEPPRWLGHDGGAWGWWSGLLLCAACARAATAEADRAFRAELQTRLGQVAAQIPSRYQWVRHLAPSVRGPESPELAARIPAAASVAAARHLRGMLARPADPLVLTLRGAAGAGKTSLAAALFWSVLGIAARGDVRAPIVSFALRARFVSARRLARECADHGYGRGSIEAYDLAAEASLLVLDDVGSERGGNERAPRDPIADLVQLRVDQELPTILTTWLDAAGAERLYGGGLARRMLTDESVARAVTVGEAPRGGGSGASGTRAP